MSDDPKRISDPNAGSRSLERILRDPLALAAIALVVVQLFTRITYDVVLSLILAG